MDQDTHPLIELQSASCGYGKKVIIDDVHFSVTAGERIAIIGDNGEGKSTLLQTLMGIQKPLKGKRFQNCPSSSIAFVAQRSAKDFLLPTRVGEFVKLGLVGLPSAKETCQNVLEQVGMLDRIHDQISTLSGGQFQRVVLARAMVRQPHLMFLDEPTTGLDRRSAREFMTELERLSKEKGLATVMVLHHFRYIERDFDRLAWIHDGRLDLDTTKNWLKNPAFLEFTGLGVKA